MPWTIRVTCDIMLCSERGMETCDDGANTRIYMKISMTKEQCAIFSQQDDGEIGPKTSKEVDKRRRHYSDDNGMK